MIAQVFLAITELPETNRITLAIYFGRASCFKRSGTILA